MEKKATILAVAGKGGVGKTSLSATIVRCLVEKYPDKKILAIDADPAVGLSTALGIDVKMTIDDIRKEIIASVDEGDTRTAIELLGEAKYRIFDALIETDGYSFIAVGRPETAGCYCKINSYLKEVISILSNEFDYVVIDGEITATFLVGYRVLSSLKKYLRDFNKTGMVLMLNSKEAFLDEEAVASRLSIDASSVKILSSKAISIMEKYNDRYDRQVSTGLLCSGKKRSLMHLIMGCYNANAADRFILIMMLLGQLLGFLVLVLSAVLNMKLFFNPVAIIAVRLIWSLITAFIVEKKK